MDSYIIETSGVSRSFDGKPAVQNLNLRVRRGGIYGFLGRNGAGKTTAIKLLVGLLKPERGEIQVNGSNPWNSPVEHRRSVGYLSEKQILIPGLRVDGLIRFTSQFYPRWDHALCERMLKKFNIDSAKRIRNLSQGTARQVGLMLALAQRPELLILDEPAATLDVVARRELLDTMLDVIREEGRTVFFSSHILSDVERVADEIGIIAQGTMRLSEPLDSLKDTVKRVRFHTFRNGAQSFQLPDAFRLSRNHNEAMATLRVPDDNLLPRLAAQHQCQFEVVDLNLEEIFVDLLHENRD